VAEFFRVEVSDEKGQIVAIESETLAGRDIGDSERETIAISVQHLMSFAGLCQHGLVRAQCLYCSNEPTGNDFLP
jgi:hypothetical protein